MHSMSAPAPPGRPCKGQKVVKRERAKTYVVYWDHLNIVKVGRAWSVRSMERRFLASGARVSRLLTDTTNAVEWAALLIMRTSSLFTPAFANAEESLEVLPHGRGWTECFRFDPDDIALVRKTINRGLENGLEVMRRLDAEAAQRASRAADDAHTPAATHSADGDGTVAGSRPDHGDAPRLPDNDPPAGLGRPVGDGRRRAHRPGRARRRRLARADRLTRWHPRGARGLAFWRADTPEPHRCPAALPNGPHKPASALDAALPCLDAPRPHTGSNRTRSGRRERRGCGGGARDATARALLNARPAPQPHRDVGHPRLPPHDPRALTLLLPPSHRLRHQMRTLRRRSQAQRVLAPSPRRRPPLTSTALP